MTNRQKLGVVLLATPIAVAFCLAGHHLGWLDAAMVFGAVIVFVVFPCCGARLIVGDE